MVFRFSVYSILEHVPYIGTPYIVCWRKLRWKHLGSNSKIVSIEDEILYMWLSDDTMWLKKRVQDVSGGFIVLFQSFWVWRPLIWWWKLFTNTLSLMHTHTTSSCTLMLDGKMLSCSPEIWGFINYNSIYAFCKMYIHVQDVYFILQIMMCI